MKKYLAIAVLAASLPALAADVGVSISISEPGVYGRIDIGRFPQPVLVVAQPVIISRPVVVVQPQPVYLWVPPGHRTDWRRYCGQYNACGVPVYFVENQWYQGHVHAGPCKRRGRDDDHGEDHGRGNEYGNGSGKSHGQGNGKGKGKD
jgi:hypothetical protein